MYRTWPGSSRARPFRFRLGILGKIGTNTTTNGRRARWAHGSFRRGYMACSTTSTGPPCSPPRSCSVRRASHERYSSLAWRRGDRHYPYDRFRAGRREGGTDAHAPGRRRRKRGAFGGCPLVVGLRQGRTALLVATRLRGRGRRRAWRVSLTIRKTVVERRGASEGASETSEADRPSFGCFGRSASSIGL